MFLSQEVRENRGHFVPLTARLRPRCPRDFHGRNSNNYSKMYTTEYIQTYQWRSERRMGWVSHFNCRHKLASAIDNTWSIVIVDYTPLHTSIVEWCTLADSRSSGAKTDEGKICRAALDRDTQSELTSQPIRIKAGNDSKFGIVDIRLISYV